jgi:hypothetical protein
MAIVSVFYMVAILISSSKQSKIIFDKDTIKITGWFGITLNHTEIDSVSMLNSNLPFMWKSWGLAFFGINKGSFMMSDGETCKLYTQTSKPPFIVIKTVHSQFVFINFKNKELLKKHYLKLLKYGNSS